MNWTSAHDLRTQLRRKWERGDLLRSMVDGNPAFPLRLSLKGPSSSEIANHFEAVRAWIVDLRSVSQIRVEFRQVNHRILGRQQVPDSAWVDTLESALTILGKRAEASHFVRLVALTREHQPALLPWLGKRPLLAIELANEWKRLLAVVDWVQRHPRPGIYVRQVDIPGIHTKFIEEYRGVLKELLDLALPPEAIDAQHTAAKFPVRYGFLSKPFRIRFRVLDPGIKLLPGPHMPDIELDATSFAELIAPVHRVFIIENEINFLSFPSIADAVVIFGHGYGWDSLAKASWLRNCTIHYWGDIDTHGFAILDLLRSHFGHTESFLMDRPTLMAHEALWGVEDQQVVHDLPRLTGTERALYDELRDNRIRKNLRLEQEWIAYPWMEGALGSVLSSERSG